VTKERDFPLSFFYANLSREALFLWGDFMTGNKRGRPKTPTTLKVLMGNPGNRPINQDEPKPKPLKPRRARIIKNEALKEWNFLSPKLHDLGLLTELDGIALSVLCKTYQRWVETEELIDKLGHDAKGNFNGFMTMTKSGYLQQLPQISIAQSYAKLMSVYLGKFGLSPADRVGMAVPKSPEKAGKFSRTLSG
jgi:P27 family predicted phage terminase small subunit